MGDTSVLNMRKPSVGLSGYGLITSQDTFARTLQIGAAQGQVSNPRLYTVGSDFATARNQDTPGVTKLHFDISIVGPKGKSKCPEVIKAASIDTSALFKSSQEKLALIC